MNKKIRNPFMEIYNDGSKKRLRLARAKERKEKEALSIQHKANEIAEEALAEDRKANAIAEKALVEARKANQKSNISIVISIAAIVVAIVDIIANKLI